MRHRHYFNSSRLLQLTSPTLSSNGGQSINSATIRQNEARLHANSFNHNLENNLTCLKVLISRWFKVTAIYCAKYVTHYCQKTATRTQETFQADEHDTPTNHRQLVSWGFVVADFIEIWKLCTHCINEKSHWDSIGPRRKRIIIVVQTSLLNLRI